MSRTLMALPVVCFAMTGCLRSLVVGSSAERERERETVCVCVCFMVGETGSSFDANALAHLCPLWACSGL